MKYYVLHLIQFIFNVMISHCLITILTSICDFQCCIHSWNLPSNTTELIRYSFFKNKLAVYLVSSVSLQNYSNTKYFWIISRCKATFFLHLRQVFSLSISKFPKRINSDTFVQIKIVSKTIVWWKNVIPLTDFSRTEV